MVEMLIGAVPVSIAAIIFESYLFNHLGTIIGLLVIAPILEEVLKFAGTARKRDVGSGLGVGLGFAFTENLLYFHSFLSGYSISSIVSVSFISSQIFLFIVMRGAFDPLLHSTLSGLSWRSWMKDKRFWLPIAIGFHVAYNFVAIIGMTSIPFLVAADIAILGPALFLLLRKARTNIQTVSPEIPTEPKPAPARKLPQKEKKFSDVTAFAFWLRENGKKYDLAEILDLSDSSDGIAYESKWLHRNILIDHGFKYSNTEIGPFGILLVAGLAALGGIAVWVLFL